MAILGIRTSLRLGINRNVLLVISAGRCLKTGASSYLINSKVPHATWFKWLCPMFFELPELVCE